MATLTVDSCRQHLVTADQTAGWTTAGWTTAGWTTAGWPPLEIFDI